MAVFFPRKAGIGTVRGPLAVSALLLFVTSVYGLGGEKVTSIYSPYKVTSSSSFVSKSAPYNHPPEWSVEGTSTRINSCFVSNREINPWWTLELDSSREIKNVQVVTPSSLRTNVNLANFDRLAMYVSNSSSISGNKTQCGATYNHPSNGSLPESVPFECGSLTGRYIHATVDPSGSYGQLILCEVIANVANDISTLTNLIQLKAEAVQSSEVNSADLAIDNNSSSSDSSKCSSTTSSTDPWLRIDLLQPHYVTEVKVKFFGDGGNDSSVAVGSSVANNGNSNYQCGSEITYSTNNGSYFSFVCDTPQLGQFVNIKRSGSSVQLQVCDVQIVYKSVLDIYRKGKISVQSEAGGWEMWKAVDRLDSAQNSNCFRSLQEASAYWRLTLPSATVISSVSILSQSQDNRLTYMNGASVYVGNLTSGGGRDNKLCGTWTNDGSNPIVINCTDDTANGIYVYVISRISRYAILYLCEVELYTPSWSSWSAWSSCSSCKQTRSRTCQPPNFTCGGKTKEREENTTICQSASTIVTNPQEATVTEFRPISLTCTIDRGCPSSSNVTWFKDGSAIALGGTKSAALTGNTSTLSVSSVETADAGSYYCQASNGIGSPAISSTAPLTVNSAVVDVQPKSQATTIGQSVSFDCQVASDVPLSELSWNDEAKQLRSSDADVTITEASGKLQLTVTPSSEAAFKNYTCKYATKSASVSVKRDGGYTTWGNWGSCSKTCGGGTQSRSRSCTNPSPLNQGNDCSGSASDSQNCNTQLCGGLPTITTGPTANAVNVSGELIVKCEASGNPAPTSFRWFRNGAELNNGVLRVTITQTASAMTLSGTLTITNVQPSSENGKYVCQATSPYNVSTSVNSSELNFKVQVAPTIKQISPSSKAVVESSSVSEKFTVSLSNDNTVYPAPSYTWKFGDAVILTDNTNDQYTFNANSTEITIPALEVFGGMYTCTASNAAGSDTKSFTFSINVPAVLSVNLMDMTVNETDDAVLNCTAHGIPTPSVAWYRVVDGNDQSLKDQQMNGTLPNGDSFATLTLRSVTGSSTGTYKCIATNDVNVSSNSPDVRMDSSTLRLTVNVVPIVSYPASPVPEVVVKGNSIRFDCLATGTPSPSFSWTLDGSPVVFGGNYTDLMNGSIGIPVAQEFHAGEYVCSASNLLGSVQSSAISLTVEVPNEIVLPPYDVNVALNASQNITIGCEVIGNPKPTVEWSNRNGLLSSTPDKYFIEDFSDRENLKSPHIVQSRLVILMPGWDDSDTYKCESQNGLFPTQSRNIGVTVQVPPEIVKNASSSTVILSTDATFTCTAAGVPNPDISWLKDDVSIDTQGSIVYTVMASDSSALRRNQTANKTSTLTIKSATNAHAGLYKCRAQNILGSADSLSARLVVQVSPTVTNDPASITRNQSDSAMFSCSATGVPAPNITWSTTSGANLMSSDVLQMSTGSDRDLYTTSSTLTLKNIQKSYDGDFTCQADNGTGAPATSKAATLTVQVRPAVTPKKTPLIGVIDKPLDLVMTITNDFPRVAAGNIVWSNQSNQMPLDTDSDPSGSKPFYQTLDSSTGIARLVIRKISDESRGGYRCTATNAAGSAFAHIVVNIEGPPEFIEQPQDVNIVEGQTATIVCEVTAAPGASFSWEKDGTPIQLGQKIRLDSPTLEEGNLVISNVNPSDVGSYSCNASNTHGFVNASAMLDVQVVPVINSPPQDLVVVQPQSATFVCSATGTPQPRITWWKNNQQLVSGSLSRRVTLSSDNKTITIAQTNYFTDKGQYECRAENELAEKRMVKATVELTINVQPEITTFPANTTSQELLPFSLTCEATGYPQFDIFWQHNGVNMTSGVVSSFDAPKILATSTLTVTNVKFADRGAYECIAKNEVGFDSSDAEVIVQYPARISQDPLGSTVIITQPVVVLCKAEGFPKPIVAWTKNGNASLPARYVVTLTPGVNSEQVPTVTSNLTIPSSKREDTGDITCSVFNGVGSENKTVPISIQEPPDMPTNVLISNVTAISVTVSWTAPLFNGNNDLTKYVVEQVQDGVTKDNVGVGSTNVLFDGLKPFTNYTFRVKAVNQIGEGKFSVPSMVVQTAQAKPEGPPTNVAVSAMSSQSILVSWQPVEAGERNGIITSYTIEYRVRTGDSSFGPSRTIANIMPTATNHLLTQLQKYTEYGIKVSASTKVDSGPFSDEKFERTDEDSPDGPPTGVGSVRVSSTSVTIAWLVPSPSNGIIRRYEVSYIEQTSSGLSIEQWKRKNVTEALATIDGLSPFTVYVFRIRAFTVGYSDYSVDFSTQTEEDAPSAPRNPSARPVSDSVVRVSWEKPEVLNGIIRGYSVDLTAEKTYTTSNGTTSTALLIAKNSTGASTTTTLVTNLQANTNYMIEIRARTVSSGPSAKTSVQTFAAAPPTLVNPGPVGQELIASNPNLETTSSSFAVRVFRSSDQFGDISHYQVVVLRLETDESSATPDTSSLGQTPDERFKQPDLKTYAVASSSETPLPYIAAEFASNLFPDDGFFIVGGENQPSDRAEYENGPVDNSEYYTVFLRAFSDSASLAPVTAKRKRSEERQYTVYTSSNWSAPILTSDKSVNTAGIAAGVVVAVLVAVIILVIFIVWFKRRRQEDKLRYVTAGLDVIDNPSADMPRAGTPSIRLKRMSTMQKVAVYEPSPPVPASQFADYCNRMRANDNYNFKVEYESIGKQAPKAPCENSASEFNKTKNRYANIVAYDSTRVALQTVEGIQGSDYVNANFLDGYDKSPGYIATQGPTESTAKDFWRMVWENESKTIVMITKLQEQGRPKCFKYWPEPGSPCIYGKLTIAAENSVELSDHVVRTFSVSHAEHAEKARTVKQFHFIQWPDHGVPLFFSPLLAFVRRVRAFNPPHDPAGPIVVHCSAGVGRTGTFIVTDAQLQRIDVEGTVDIYGYTLTIRRQRNFMVQTENQYVFVHGALVEAIASGKTAVDTTNLRRYIQKLSAVDPETEMTGIEKQFKKLAIRNELLGPALFKAANVEANHSKNRTTNIVPYDTNRVMLMVTPGVEGSDYINASFVDSYQRQQGFIATQSPLPETINDFWRMIWEKNSSTIVMLCQLNERGQEACAQYWPSTLNKKAHYGNLVISAVKQNNLGDYTLREFTVTHTKENEMRTVRQFHYTAWPEGGVPANGASVIDLVGQVDKSQRNSSNGPVTVHCSTGVGRTGCLLALSIALERMKAENVVDLFLTVKLLRTQRPGMVQTMEQFKFCYATLLEYLDSFDLYSNFK